MFETTIKSTIFDRDRKLIITPDLIEFDDSDWNNIPNSRFSREEVAAFRYGVKCLSGSHFTIGRKYCIEIKGLAYRSRFSLTNDCWFNSQL